MKRLVTVTVPAILLVGLILIGLNDTSSSLAYTKVYDIETYVGLPDEASNSSASASITITMYTGDE